MGIFPHQDQLLEVISLEIRVSFNGGASITATSFNGAIIHSNSFNGAVIDSTSFNGAVIESGNLITESVNVVDMVSSVTVTTNTMIIPVISIRNQADEAVYNYCSVHYSIAICTDCEVFMCVAICNAHGAWVCPGYPAPPFTRNYFEK